ncbi:unnamed protein product, partial [Musa acuminata subsp. burmannicoides]
ARHFLFHCRRWGALDPQSLVRGHRWSPAFLSGGPGSHQSLAVFCFWLCFVFPVKMD